VALRTPFPALSFRTLDSPEPRQGRRVARSADQTGPTETTGEPELPTELGEPQHGLFPRFVDELDFECTCPDWGWPCKHAAALVHVLVEDVDARPQTLLALRGVDVDPLLGVATPVDDEAALADSLPAYWSPRAALVPPPVRFRPAIDELDEGLLRSALRCAGGGSAADKDAVAWLRDCYRRLG